METRNMNSLALQVRGVSYKPEDVRESLDESSVMLLRANNITDGKINFDDVVYVDKKKVAPDQYLRRGDILICASSGSKHLVGKAATIDFDRDVTFGAFCKVVRPRLSEDMNYVSMYFQSPQYRREISSVAIGVNINNIRNEHIDALSINWPSVDVREDAVAVLRIIDTIIHRRKTELITFDDLVKARFVELFGDCRLNPKGWKTVPLGNIAEVGSSKRVFVEELKESGIPFYRGTEVGALAEGKRVIPELFITENHYDELVKATGKPELGDLLMPSICPDGRIWVVDTDEPFYFKDGRVLWVHGIDTSFDPVFLLYTLKDRIMTDYGSIASGTTFAELKIFALKQCQVFAVPIEEQRSFAAFITQVDKSKIVA